MLDEPGGQRVSEIVRFPLAARSDDGSRSTQFASNANFPINYLWTPSAGLNDPTKPSPAASPADDIIYTLKVTSDKGCYTTDDVFVKC